MATAKNVIPEGRRKADNLAYFMKLACYSAMRTKDPTIKSGAVIVRNDRQVVATGYLDYAEPLDEELKDYYRCHAAINSLLSARDVRGCTMYLTTFPCSDCLMNIVEAGITDIIHLEEPKVKDGKIVPEHRCTENVMMLIPSCANMCRSYRSEVRHLAKSPSVRWPPRKFEMTIKPVQAGVKLTPEQEDNHYFMGLAYLAARRSYDPYTKAGACIVTKEKKVVGLGSNSLPVVGEGILTWHGNREQRSDPKWIKTKYPYIIHATGMAILNKNIPDVRGCTLYVTHYPDYDCAKAILRTGIDTVVYWRNENGDQKEVQVGKKILENAKPAVNIRQFKEQQYASWDLLDDTQVEVFEKPLIVPRAK